MATRPSKTTDTGALDLAEVFKVLASFEVTQDDPVSTEDFALELGVTPSEAFNALDTLANAELVDAKGRGLSAEWWINVPDVSEDNALNIAREALGASVTVADTPSKPKRKNKAEKDAEARARLEYATRAAESQEEGAQHLHPMPDARPVVPAETPIVAENGENVTIPVDFDNPEKGRRELDAAKGERLISEETITVKVASKPERLPEIDGLNQYVDEESGDMVYESRIHKMGLALPEPDSIPERPEGVHPNTWDMAHTAITQTARDYWLRVAKAQQEAHSANAA